ncbi:alpha amylase C-terminal domain-containing protein, partial [Streptomyces mirabilis]|uniref:alpha amylase C-terminal domain-containing protein n=1 Tax=Streptomyces mirabilis TaxID=68239 RepID=UPI00340CFCCC
VVEERDHDVDGHDHGQPAEPRVDGRVLNTDAARYGGSDIHNPHPVKPEPHPAHAHPTSLRLTLPPLATIWLRPA